MNKNYFLIAITLISLLFARCKKDELDLSKGFIKYFGGIEFDEAADMRPTGDGGYIMIGSTSTTGKGGTDIYLVKADSKGNQEWSRTYGDILNDNGASVYPVSDGGFILIGTYRYVSGTDSNKTDIYVIRTNSSGDPIWTKKFGYSGVNDEGVSIRQTADGGFILIGNTMFNGNWDVYILKLLADGSPEVSWPVIRPAPNGTNGNVQDLGVNIVEKPGGGFVYSSSIDDDTSTLGKSPRLVSLNFVGIQNSAPDKSYYSELDMENAGEVSLSSSNTFLVGKTVTDNSYVLKMDATVALAKQWYKTFGGVGSDVIRSVEATDDGGCIVLGSTTSFGAGSSDIYALKLNSNGDEVWFKTFGGAGFDVGKVIRKTSDGGYAILGTLEFGDDPSTKDNIISLIKINSAGEIEN